MADEFNLKSKLEQRKDLRNHSTSAEAVLWKRLKNRQVLNMRFRRSVCRRLGIKSEILRFSLCSPLALHYFACVFAQPR